MRLKLTSRVSIFLLESVYLSSPRESYIIWIKTRQTLLTSKIRNKVGRYSILISKCFWKMKYLKKVCIIFCFGCCIFSASALSTAGWVMCTKKKVSVNCKKNVFKFFPKYYNNAPWMSENLSISWKYVTIKLCVGEENMF